MSGDGKVRENRLRRMAVRQGKQLHKSRRRDPRALDYGQWYIVDSRTTVLLAECNSLDEVESLLSW